MATSDLLIPLAVAVIAAIPGVLAYRSSLRATQRASAMETSRVGIDSWNQLVDQLQEQLDFSHGQLSELRDMVSARDAALEALRVENRKLLGRIGDLEKQVGHFARQVAQLKVQPGTPQDEK